MCGIQFVFISIAAPIARVTTLKNMFAAAVHIFKTLSVHFCVYLFFWEFCCLFTTKLLTKIFLFLLYSVPSCDNLFSRKLGFKNYQDWKYATFTVSTQLPCSVFAPRYPGLFRITLVHTLTALNITSVWYFLLFVMQWLLREQYVIAHTGPDLISRKHKLFIT
jgi:hypothetical protein